MAHRKLTERECRKVLGSIIGGLATTLSDVATTRAAVQWWANTDAAWALFAGRFTMDKGKLTQISIDGVDVIDDAAFDAEGGEDEGEDEGEVAIG